MSQTDTLYVGYLGAPPSHARFVKRFVGAALVTLAALGAIIAGAQGPAGEGTWDDSDSATFEGLLLADPYPHLLTNDADGSELDAILVEQGKFGADPRAAGLAGKPAKVRGGLIRHPNGKQAVIELSPLSDAIAPAEGTHDARPPLGAAAPKVAGSFESFVGEVVDPKCWLGVMNPGRGKPHLSCAELCIRGGIPPVLVVRDPEHPGGRGYLLVDELGAPMNSAVRGLIGFPVQVIGRVVPGGWERLEVRTIQNSTWAPKDPAMLVRLDAGKP